MYVCIYMHDDYIALHGLRFRKSNLEARMRRVSLGIHVYLIWEEMNKQIFEGKCWGVDRVFRRFQILFYTIFHFHAADHSRSNVGWVYFSLVVGVVGLQLIALVCFRSCWWFSDVSSATTRFHSFIDGHIPSVCDRTFVGKLFTDYIADGIIPSEYLLLVIPHFVAISVGNTKNTFNDGPCAPKKKSFPLGIYRWKIFRRCYVNTDGCSPSVKVSVIFHTDRIFPSVNSSVIVYQRIISVGEYVDDGMEYRRHCPMPTDLFRR